MLAMISCTAKRKLTIDNNPVSNNNPPANSPANVTLPVVLKPDSKMAAIKAQQFDFNTFSGKANTKLSIDGSNNDVTLNIRIDRDKQIWVSITATVLITVEIARAVITPDSIRIINKLQGVYIKKPFSYIYNYSNDQINYKTLESIFVGNALPEILNDDNAAFQTDNGNTIITGNLQDMLYKLMLGADMKVAQLNLSNHNQGQALQINNSDFISVSNRVVPSQIAIQSVSQDKKIQCNLHYIKVDLDRPLQYPFNIPENYKSADGN
jgi:hypothetical protein